MFSLVKFENGEYSVLPTKRVSIIQDGECIVKVKNGAKYCAHLLDTSDCEKDLTSAMTQYTVVDTNKEYKCESTDESEIQIAHTTKSNSRSRSRTKKKKKQLSADKKTINRKHSSKTADLLLINTEKQSTSTVETQLVREEINNNVGCVHENTTEASKTDDNINLNAMQNQGENDTMETLGLIADETERKLSQVHSDYDDNNERSLMSNEDTREEVNFSTPIDRAKIIDFGDCNISGINCDESFVPETPECSVPSGYTEILASIGDDLFTYMTNGQPIQMVPNDNEMEFCMTVPLHEDDNNQLLTQVNDEIKDKNEVIIAQDPSLDIDNIHTPRDQNAKENTIVISQENDPDNSDQAEDPNDPLYSPDESIDNTRSTKSSNRSTSKTIISSFDESPALDVRTLEVPSSKIYHKRNIKRHFCIYCKKLVSKFARHLISKHKNEDEVKKFINYPNGQLERRKIIDLIRKKGDFEHNIKPEYNTGTLIPMRQRQQKYNNTAEDYICCKICQGFFSKKTLRVHFSKCNQAHKKGSRNIRSAGRRISGYIHNKANKVLRRTVFPILRDDEVTRAIKYDELIILYGNKMCDKYTLDHQHDMIRSQLRLLGRFKLAMMNLDPEVTDLASIITPKRFDSIVHAIRIVAKWDESIKWFKIPAVAQNLATLIKKVTKKYRSLNLRSEDDDDSQLKKIDNFLLLWEEEIPILINKKALEDQVLQKRQKKIVLPSKQDIQKLFEYIKNKAAIDYKTLQNNFDSAAWTSLNQCTLILIQIFNRRRAGEIERLKLSDFDNKEALNENVNMDLCANLSAETMEFAKQYVRLTLRGKLARTVSVLLSPFVVRYIDILVKYRKDAQIKSDNEYVFAVPNTTALKKKYIRACPLMRKFATECGASISHSLRGTTLRKHIATFTAMLDVEETQVNRLANFLGHHKDVHKEIYRVPVPVAEMTVVSRLLVAAMGGDNEENENQSEDSDGEEGEGHGPPDNTEESTGIERNGADFSTSMNSDGNDEADLTQNDITTRPKSSTNSRKRKRTSNSSGEIRRRSTSPYGKTKRRHWNEAEKTAVISYFGKLENLKRLPNVKECQAAITQYKVLANRTPNQVKGYINNIRTVQSRREYYANKKICN